MGLRLALCLFRGVQGGEDLDERDPELGQGGVEKQAFQGDRGGSGAEPSLISSP